MAQRLMTQDSWMRLERRISKLEDAMDNAKLTPQEISNIIHELLDLKQSFYVQMDSRPKIREALPKYHAVLSMMDDQEGSGKGMSAFKSEVLLNELPRVQGLASSTDSLEQLQSVLKLKPLDDLNGKTASLLRTKEELASMLKKMDGLERVQNALTEAETSTISLTEEKLLEIDGRLS